LPTNQLADLHLHTNRSDGLLSPTEVIERAAAVGIKVVSITDHDEICALDEACRLGEKLGVEVLVGVELSSSFNGRDLHLLGYLFDPNHPRLVDYLEFFRAERVRRTEKILDRLKELGMPLSLDDVLRSAGSGSVGRPHIADALVKAGYVSTFQEAFNRFLADDQPAFVPKFKISPKEAIELVHEAGGVASIAHPGLDLTDDVLGAVIEVGADAIEIVHPQHNAAQQAHYRAIARAHGLLETGGSDFHGGRKGDDVLGKYNISLDAVERLKEKAGRG
jgi:predicted metal-dependent phosphoesterase TrpH